MSVEIPLYYAAKQNRKRIYEVVGFTHVDEDDASLAMEFRWCMYAGPRNHTNYARRMVWRDGRRYELRLHNFIMGDPPEGHIWDHADLDGLNNRRSNLRLASVGQNHTNRGIQRNNSSGYKGVSLYRRIGKYAASVGWEGKPTYLGVFECRHAAAFAYNVAAAHLYGEFARPNEIGLSDMPTAERREEIAACVRLRLGNNRCLAGKGSPQGIVAHSDCFSCLREADSLALTESPHQSLEGCDS